MNLKTLNLTVLLITILVLVPTIQIVYASPLSTFYLSGGIYPQGTYTIWREGSTYYAKNAYGSIDYSGSNFTEVVENTFSDVPLYPNDGRGQKILLRSLSNSYYSIDTPINVDKSVSIEGEGSIGSSYATIKSTIENGAIFNVTQRDVEISHLNLQGKGKAYDTYGISVDIGMACTVKITNMYLTGFTYALYLNHTIDSYFDNLNIRDNSYGLYMTGNCYLNQFIQCQVCLCDVAIYLGTYPSVTLLYNKFDTMDIEVNGIGIQARYCTYGNIFQNIWLESSTTYDIDFNDTSGYAVVCENHFLWGHLGYATGLKVIFGSGAYNNTIESGRTYANTIYNLTDNGSGNRIRCYDYSWNGTDVVPTPFP